MKFATLATAAMTAFALTGIAQAAAPAIIQAEETGEGGGGMALKLDRNNAPAGEVIFKLKNSAVSEDHEMIVVKLKAKDQKIPLDLKKHRIDEKSLKTLGEIADVKPGEGGELKLTLKPGDYLLFCNIKGHYEAGMWAPFTVAKQQQTSN